MHKSIVAHPPFCMGCTKAVTPGNTIKVTVEVKNAVNWYIHEYLTIL